MRRSSIFFNPFTDFGFKKLFGEEGSKDLLIDFLNQLLPESRHISTLNFLNSEDLPQYKDERKSIFDIYCIGVNGERFIVEMQKARWEFFKERALFYSTSPIRAQGEKGDWDFNLAPVYLIAILDFVFDSITGRKKDIRIDVMLKDQHGEPFYEKLNFCFIQMPLFDKKEDELETHFDKWMFFLKNLESFDHIPQVLREPIFEKGFEIARISNLDKKARIEYEANRKNYLDMMNAIETAKKEGIQEGIVLGIEKGIARGEKEKSIQIAKSMLNQNFSIEQIVSICGLTSKEVERIARKATLE